MNKIAITININPRGRLEFNTLIHGKFDSDQLEMFANYIELSKKQIASKFKIKQKPKSEQNDKH